LFEVLLVVIGVLVLIGLLLVGRSRRGGSDPSTSVDAFNRALTAMEPGADGQGGRRRRQRATDGAEEPGGPASGEAGEAAADTDAAPEGQRDGSSH
jgi:FtsZ-interacting cell division protein ZipA